MPSTAEPESLLRTEAVERKQLLTVGSMLVELDLTGPGDVFASTTTIGYDAATDADTFVDFKGVELRSAVLDGVALEVSSWAGGRIPLPGRSGAHTLVVDGVMGYSSDGEGLHRHVDPADDRTYLYAMSFLDAAPRWFACFDQPDLKAPYRLRVLAPAEWTVVGNGPSVSPAPGRWEISPPQPLSTYYVTLVAGPYATVRAEHDGIPLGLHVRASLAEALAAEAPDLFAATRASLDYYHRVFGVRYPFGEYHQAFVPDFNAGAMENPGCVTFRDQYIYRARATASERAGRATTVAHEMAHMWFGDLVTMAWWDDLWLNESFAEYMAHRACDEALGHPSWTEFGISRKDWGSVADQAPSTHPVAGNGSADAQSALQDFDGISYAKGAAVLKQLVAYLGDDVFFAGLRRYFDAHAFGNAQFSDLMAAWTAAGARDLDAWAAVWLRTSGMDTLDVAGDGATVTVSATAPAATPGDRPGAGPRGTGTVPSGTPSRRTHAVQVAAVDAAGYVASRESLLLAGDPVEVAVPAGPALVVPDAGDDTWAKIRFGADGWSRVAAVLPAVVDPAVRVVVLNAVRDAVRDADLDPGRALEVVCDAVGTESSDVVTASLLRFAQDQLAGPYAPPAARAARRLRVHTTARAIAQRADAGSDQQLAAFRAAVRSSDDPALLQAWRAGHDLPDGLALDPELLWAVVTRLASLTGEAGLIEAALRDDPSASAHRHAARARAGLPTATAKADAWRLLTTSTSASAYEVYATAEAFFDPAQEEVTAPYVERYFAEVPATAAFRSGWSLAQVATLAFPGASSTPGTLASAQRTLERDDLAPLLRRALVDSTDRLRRAVVSLERWSDAPGPS